MSGEHRGWRRRTRSDSRLRVPGGRIVRLVALLVPASRRVEWSAEWQSELIHAWHDRRGRGQSHARVRLTLQMRSLGSVGDALSLRSMVGRTGLIRQDLRQALRLPRRHPGFAASIVLTLGLGIGAATSIFTVLDGLLLRPLPFRDPDQLVAIGTGAGEYPSPFVDREAAGIWGARDDVFADVRAYRHRSVTVTGQGEPRFTSSAQLEPGFLVMLGISPILGRGFLAEEAVPGRDRVVLLGEELWQTAYGGDRSVVGRAVTIDGDAHTVVGVVPSALRMLPTGRVEIVTPLVTRTLAVDAGVALIARLRSGIGIGEAQDRLGTLARTLETERPRAEGWSVRLVALENTVISGVHDGMILLAAAVALLLLIACANAAGLLVVRSAGRQHEFAVRAALGGGRVALLRQLLCEGVVLAVLAGGLGILLGYAGVLGLLAIIPPQLVDYSYTTVRLDARVLAFAMLITATTGVLFGAIPAFHTTRLSSALATAGRGATASRTQRRFRSTLVVLELALAVVLLAGAGLLGNSFARLLVVEPGVDADRLLVMELQLPSTRYDTPETRIAFRNQLDEHLRAIPGVRAVSFSRGGVPPSPNFMRNVAIETEQRSAAQPLPILAFARVDTGYFSTLGITFVEGRSFDAVDMQGENGHVVIDRDLVQLLWQGTSALGRRFRVRAEDGWLTVVGVVSNVKLGGPADRFGRYELYYPTHPAEIGGYFTVVVRSAGDPVALTQPLRQTIDSLDPALPIMDVQTAAARFDLVLGQPKFLLMLVTVFALLALALAAVGIYGLVAYDVAQRTREIGVRVALGADRRRIIVDVLRSGMLQTAIGIGLGIASALALSRFIAGLLFGITPTDPVTFVAVAATLTGVCILALMIPARRAALIHPTEALRVE